MTDIIKFNEEHTPKTEIGKMKFELAEALTAISDLQNPYRLTELSKEQCYKLYNKSMRKVCEILDIDLDMHEMMKTGAEGFSYSDTEDDTKTLEQLVSNNRSHDIKTKLFTLFTLASGLSHSDTDFIAVDDKGAETPATQQELAKALRTNLVELTESLGLSLDQVTENHTEQAQDTVKSIIGDLKELTSRPYAYVGNDVDSLGDLIGDTLEQLYEALGFDVKNIDMMTSKETSVAENTETPNITKLLIHAKKLIFERELSKDDMADTLSIDLGILAELLGIEDDLFSTKYFDHVTTIKEQLQDIYSLNDSMITGDPNHIPTYDDGTVIKQSDLADMNMNALDLIAEMLGFELEEGATQLVQSETVNEKADKETYDTLPAEDKLNVDMLNKLHEVQDHILKSGQDAVSMNQVQTAISILEGSLGVTGKSEE